MLRGFYTAASGMIAQQRQQEALSNNIANANTPGFKADRAAVRAFPEMLMERMGTKSIPVTRGLNIPANKMIGALNTGVYVQEAVPDFSQGDLKETGLSTDLAIVQDAVPDKNGALFFTVQNENGEARYTRNGNFTVDSAGFLVTNQGYRVLDTAGNPVETGGMEFQVADNGTIELQGRNIPLGIAYARDANQLAKEGNDLFRGEAEAVPAGATFAIHQGALEQSNVDAMQSMTQMMESYRVYETNQRVLKAYDESMGKAVSEIGRIG